MLCFKLVDCNGTESGDVYWDEDAGALSGDSRHLELAIEHAVKAGEIRAHPYGVSHPISDPLHNRTEMALVVGRFWLVPPELREYHPVFR